MTARQQPFAAAIAAWEQAAARAREQAAWWGLYLAGTMSRVLAARRHDPPLAAHEMAAYLRLRQHAAWLLRVAATADREVTRLRARATEEEVG